MIGAEHRRRIAARLANMKQGRPEKASFDAFSFTRDQAATALGVSVKSVERARSIIKHGTDEEVASIALMR